MPTVETLYLGGLRTEATHLKSGIKILTDAPVDNHGKGEAFSPTDLTTGSCMLTIIGILAGKEHIELAGTHVSITKTMSVEAPRRIVKIKINASLVSDRKLSSNEQDKLECAARTCPVALSLHPDIEQLITFEWHVAENKRQ